MPRAAINIVTWNSENYIEACIKAVLNQSCKDISITVIDNASTDATIQCIDRFSSSVTIIQNSSNTGYATAHNQGIDRTESDYVLTLNPDVVLRPDFVQSMIDAADQHPTIGSVCGKLVRIAKEDFGQQDLNAPLDPSLVIDEVGIYMKKNRRQHLRGYLENASNCYIEPAYIFGASGAAAFYRRAMLEDICIEGQYFDEKFFIHKEDVDLAWRAQLLGWKSYYTPDAVGYHVRTFRPGVREGISSNLRHHATKNRWLMIVKNELPLLFLRDLPFIAIYDIGILGYLILREQESLSGVVGAISLLPAALRWRTLIQQRRRGTSSEMGQWFT